MYRPEYFQTIKKLVDSSFRQPRSGRAKVDEGLALLDDLGTLGVLRSNKSRGQLFDYTETFYNSKLLLSALGYLSPVATRGKPNTRVTSRKVAVCSRN